MTSTSTDSTRSWPTTSLGLLERSLAGQGDAWRELTSVYGPLVYGWIRRSGIPRDEAPDVMQEVFLAVYRGLGQYRLDRGRFRGWLHRLAQNVAIDYHRRRGRQPVAEGGTAGMERQRTLVDPVALEANGHEAESTNPPSLVLLRVLELLRSRFQEQTWTAAWRVIVEHQDPALVAESLQLSIASVYTAKSRVLACLREELRTLGE